LNGIEKSCDLKKYRLLRGIVIGGSIFIGCFSFPLINTHLRDIGEFVNIIFVLLSLDTIGSAEAYVFPKMSVKKVFLMNFFFVIAGLLCRYLLEFGEISNVYNFTAPNVLIQIAAGTLLSSLSYMRNKNKKQ